MAIKKNTKNIYIEKEEAMILAAGKGKRMRNHSLYKAKPLININKKSLLESNLLKLSESGIKTCIVNSSHKHLSVEKLLKNYNYKNKNPNILMSYEKNILETGGGVKNALPKFKNDRILVINGDSLLIENKGNCPIKELFYNFNNDVDVLLLLAPKKNTIGYSGNGDFIKTSKKKVFEIKRKSIYKKDKLVFTGWQIIRKELFKEIEKKFFSLNLIYDLAEKKKKLYGILFDGLFLHTSTPKSLFLIKKYIKFKNYKII